MIAHANRNNLLDRAALWLSGLCAVHCLASAVLAALLASAGSVFGHHVIHEVGLAIAIVFGALALGFGAWTHGYLMPIAVGSLRIGVMMGALSLPHDGGELLYTLIGVAILALGHDLNYRATN